MSAVRPTLLLVLAACGASPAPGHAPRAPETAVAAARVAVPPLPAIDPAAMPKKKPIVLKAARLFDGRGDKAIDGGAMILVENGLVAKVGKSFAAPPDAETIDLGDATILPGFIDAHTHVTHEMSPNFYKDRFDEELRFPAEQAHFAAAWAKKTLDAGFTTVRDLGSNEGLDIGLRNAIAKDVTVGPRMLVAVHALGATGGHVDRAPFIRDYGSDKPAHDGVCDGAEACAAAVRKQIKYGADVIKISASGGVLSLADAVDTPQLTLEEMRAIVAEAHRLGRKVAAHCHGDTAAKVAIEAGVDSIEHGSFLKPDTLALMKRKGTVLIPTLMASHWTGDDERSKTYPPAIGAKARAARAAHVATFKEAVKAGVVIGFGTDSGVSPHGQNAHEFVLLNTYGMPAGAALRAATSVDAELLGIATQTGTLEAGKLADVVAVPGDPLTDIKQTEKVSFVMRAGTIYKRPDGSPSPTSAVHAGGDFFSR
jgi:imidazolonepropionase-like amidohydrolase